MSIPEGFTEQFLDWIRIRTENAWANYRSRTFEEYVAARVGGQDWQRGTKWLDGLSEEEINQVERQWSVRFPPDYRLFLRQLHAVDRPTRGASYTEYVEEGEESHLVPKEKPAFYNWMTDTEALQDAFNWLVEGLQFDAEFNNIWLPTWGPKPGTVASQKERIRELVANAPKLIPIIGHSYLLAEPCQAGNPIFSVYQSDIIVFNSDLHDFFLFEFTALLGIEGQWRDKRLRDNDVYAAIPFWGDFLVWNNAFSEGP